MKIKILCQITLTLSALMLFSNEKFENNLKIFSNVEKEITGKKSNYQYSKEKPRINKSNKINYPHKKEDYHHNIIKKKDTNLQIDKTNKKQDVQKPINNIVKIRKSNKIYYPQDKNNIQTSKSKKNIWYNIKVYSTHTKDRFKKIKALNKINTQIENNFALIGPILEDYLGEITKALHVIGYSELEYIKVEQN
ncbi:hypothetical protein [Borrelia turicatae]|uniref:Uncharacterized protein n=2 Tax=Borrelia turicatae TaxID=142 RepID=A0A172XAC6_BORTU|nr:hypothetical protein [Borrelia turicatae]AAX17443.1 hypothetical protein BT0102 [Borrelia turicatae 91E135]ANF33610.1 hypothetical protein A7978_00495 [Borrelia turicatae]UPA12980.1 hypothetical protein bt91E135_000099 [Borrelia turicatae 91E135]UPA14467.1 hypothetical protein btBTE5EL_000099 [Borrelia turicatae]